MERVKTLAKGIEVTNSEPVPLVLPISIRNGGAASVAGGMPMVEATTKYYVCIDQLPPELQERIRTAVTYLMRP